MSLTDIIISVVIVSSCLMTGVCWCASGFNVDGAAAFTRAAQPDE
jgi:hypothetical protein